MVAESTGGWGPTAISVLNGIARVAARRSGGEISTYMAQYLEGLCVCIRRAHAKAVLRRCQGAAEELVSSVSTAAAIVQLLERNWGGIPPNAFSQIIAVHLFLQLLMKLQCLYVFYVRLSGIVFYWIKFYFVSTLIKHFHKDNMRKIFNSTQNMLGGPHHHIAPFSIVGDNLYKSTYES